MKPFIIDHWGTNSNQLLANLLLHVKAVIADPLLDIDSPEAMEDQINEWLGSVGKTYRRCRWESVVMMNRPYNSHYFAVGYKGPLECPCLRIFYEGQDSLSLFLIMAIGFYEEGQRMTPTYGRNDD